MTSIDKAIERLKDDIAQCDTYGARAENPLTVQHRSDVEALIAALQEKPEPIEGLDDALLCGKHPDQARDFKEKYGKPYYEVVQEAAKRYADQIFLDGKIHSGFRHVEIVEQ